MAEVGRKIWARHHPDTLHICTKLSRIKEFKRGGETQDFGYTVYSRAEMSWNRFQKLFWKR